MKKLFKILRFAVCVALIYFVVSRVDYQPLKEIFTRIRLQYCFFILGILFIQNLIKALKWHTLLLAKQIHVSVLKILQIDFASTFLSLFVPSSISLDLFRAYGLSKEVASKKQTASSIIVDRALSLSALLAVANISVILFYNTINTPKVVFISVSILIGFMLAVFLIQNDKVYGLLGRYKEPIRTYKLFQKLNELRHSINEYKFYKNKMFTVFLLSFGMQLCRILIYYCASLAVGAEIPFKYFMIYTPLVMLLVMLPISLAGIGLREGSFVFFFTKVGVSASTAFAISALVSFLVVLAILPGGLILAFKGLALKKESPIIEESSVTP